jgi:hypothetical protein
MFTLPEEHRKLFKEPFGTLHPTIEAILPLIMGKQVYTVGDVVTHNLQKNGIVPAIAIVDGFTMRMPCRRMPEVTGNQIMVRNPAGCITDALIRALEAAVEGPPTTIVIDGEEDLAVIPMVIAAPVGSVVLYGQPGAGVVLLTVTLESQEEARKYLGRFIHTPDV